MIDTAADATRPLQLELPPTPGWVRNERVDVKVMSVVGARPQLVKLAPIASALSSAEHTHHIVHTGQHYDREMSEVFFTGLGIPKPDVHLGVGSGSHAGQTGAMLIALGPIIEQERPDWVLVYGDTNSTIAAALAAVKLHAPLAHLEAGLRSFNRLMPEEHNRILTDHAADLLLAPTEVARGHLEREGLADRTIVVGDVMVDVCLRVRDAIRAGEIHAPTLPPGVDPTAPYLVCTLHRPGNTDDPERLEAILQCLAELPLPVALLAHPRLVAKAETHGLKLERGSVHVRNPLPYADLIGAVTGSVGVITDSGGLQKEAYVLERICTTIRPETEWVETMEAGWNVLEPDPHHLTGEQWSAVATRSSPSTPIATPFGDGTAARSVVEALAERADQ